MSDKKLKQGHKQLLELLPLLVFFLVYLKKNMVWATGALAIASVLVIGLIYVKDRTLSKAQIIGVMLVVVFGGLTVYFNDPAYLVAKVSVINVLFGLVLLGGYLFKRAFIKDLMGEAMALPDHAWMSLSLRWAFFFFFLAALNLVIWFNFSEKVWAAFKLGGLLGLTLLFAFANAPFMAKHMIEDKSADGTKPSGDG
jgi:intracellular septation protein